MGFRQTLQMAKELLTSKLSLSEAEKALLDKIIEDLEYFPRGTLHRDDCISLGFDGYAADDYTLEAVADAIGSDCWEQMSNPSAMIIMEAKGIPNVRCPLCGADEIQTEDTQCNCAECNIQWDHTPYVLLEHNNNTMEILMKCKKRYHTIYPDNQSGLLIPLPEFNRIFGVQPYQGTLYRKVGNISPLDMARFITKGHTVQQYLTKELDVDGRFYWVSVNPAK